MMERLGKLEQQHRHTMEAFFQMKENVSDYFNAYTEQAGACLWSAYKPKVHFLTESIAGTFGFKSMHIYSRV